MPGCRTIMGVLVAGSLALGACGSSLGEKELARANAPFLVATPPPDLARHEVVPDTAPVATLQARDQPTWSAAPPAGPPRPEPVRLRDPGDATTRGPNAAVVGTAPVEPGRAEPRAADHIDLAGVPGSDLVPPAEPRTEIRLGSIGQQSGPIGAQFATTVDAARAWVADVNGRGGLAGHPVRLRVADDGGDPSRALALTRKMVENDRVIALYAGQAALTLGAITPYLEQRGVPMIYNTPTNPAVDESPMVFNATAGAKLGTQWSHLAGLAHFSDKRRIAVIYCREAQSCSQLAAGVARVAPLAGFQVMFQAQVSLAQPDYTAEMLAARNAGADAVVAVLDNASVLRLIRSAHRQDWFPVVSTQMGSYEERFLSAGGEDVEGVVIGGEVPWSSSGRFDEYRAAIDRFVPGGSKGSLGAAAWVAGKLLERTAWSWPANPTSTDVLAGLWNLRGETLDGLIPPVTFARDSGHELTNPCVVPVKIEDRRFLVAPQYTCPPSHSPGSSPAG